MSNQNLIDYMNYVKQSNGVKISELNQTINTIDDIVDGMNIGIANYETQKTDTAQQISTIQDQNVLIDETIAILNAQP